MNATGMSFGSREQEVSTISRNLKALAKDLDIPIIALSQLNRSVEGRAGSDGKRPQLSDLRESGAIEQDADMVCFIHRPEYYFRNGERSEGYDAKMIGMAEIIVAKHRNGATKTVVLRFDQSHARFLNTDDTYSAPEEDSAVLEQGSNKQEFASYGSSMNYNAIMDDTDSPI